MPAAAVHLESDAYLVCLTHALSTEREEVMGLLIGEVGLSVFVFALNHSVIHSSATKSKTTSTDSL
jgi:hypothetical protein